MSITRSGRSPRPRAWRQGGSLWRLGPWLLVLAALLAGSTARGVKPGDPPAAVLARRALLDGNFAEAIRLYEIALAAAPESRLDWYNFTCALALHGERARALEALAGAFAAGYSDSSWTATDPDLSSLRGEPEFLRLTREMAALARRAPAEGVPQFHVAQTRLAGYALDLPPGCDPQGAQRYPLILLLHGRGTNGESMRRFAADLRVPDAIIARADAPYAIVGGGGFEYWPAWTQADAHAAAQREAARFAARWCHEIVRDALRRAPVDPRRVFVIGFSQGAAMAYLAALENPALFAGAAPLAGWVPAGCDDPAGFRRLAEQGVALFIGHGSQDTAVAPERAEAAQRLAAGAGVSVTARTYPVGHTVSAELMADLSAWIREVCAARAGVR